MRSDKDVLFNIDLTSSKGNQLKCKTNNRWYKADYLGYEGVAEYLSSYICQHSNIQDYVSYSLANITIPDIQKTFKGCSSENFLREGEELITADKLLSKYISKDFAERYKKLSLKQFILSFVNDIENITQIDSFGADLTKMLELDMFILNDDRHFNNIAFIRDNSGSYRFAPIFDNGGAFLTDTTYDYPMGKSIYGLISNVKAKPFSTDFEKQVDICRELYGEQLQISKNIDISNIISNIEKSYGTEIASRINGIYEQQKYLYMEMFVNKDFSANDKFESIDLSVEELDL